MSARILLIEDNPQNRYLATFLLEKRGHTVLQAATGFQGLAMAASARPDLILLDIQLPGMDGHSVARALKADPRCSRIPIIAVTSYAMVGDREKCLEAGAEGYLEKPIDAKSFVTQIERYLRPPAPARDPTCAR